MLKLYRACKQECISVEKVKKCTNFTGGVKKVTETAGRTGAKAPSNIYQNIYSLQYSFFESLVFIVFKLKVLLPPSTEVRSNLFKGPKIEW